jgi:hypothetical protein
VWVAAVTAGSPVEGIRAKKKATLGHCGCWRRRVCYRQVRVCRRRVDAVKRRAKRGGWTSLDPCCDGRGLPGTLNECAKATRQNTSSVYIWDGNVERTVQVTAFLHPPIHMSIKQHADPNANFCFVRFVCQAGLTASFVAINERHSASDSATDTSHSAPDLTSVRTLESPQHIFLATVAFCARGLQISYSR